MKSNKIILLTVILLAAVAGWYIYNWSAGTIKTELRDFAVKDTASITKIFIADRKGNKSLLTKQAPGKWIVNEKYPVANRVMNTLLYTMAKIEVRSPAGKAAYNTVMKYLSTDGIKVEIYTNKGLLKTYYVGQPSQDMLGTFMYLENSSVPFIIHIPGFDGFLTTRYIANPMQWRDHIIFNYGYDDIKLVQIINLEDTASSFRMVRSGDEFLYYIPPAAPQPTKLLKSQQAAYIARYEKIGYEWDVIELSKHIKDSIINSMPFRKMMVADVAGKRTEIAMYRKMTPENTLTSIDQRTGKLRPFDIDRMYAVLNNDTSLVVLQYQLIDPLFKKPDVIKGFGN